MLIYTITNLINGKQYVGQTSATMNRRMTIHKAHSKTCSYPLYSAFKKYGLASFLMEKIDMAETREELNNKEIMWISKLNTITPNGYNIQPGGFGGGIKPGQYAGNKNPMWGKMQSIEGRQRISEAARLRMTGRVVSQATRDKLRANATGVIFTGERKANISKSKMGCIPWNKGKKQKPTG